MTGLVDTDLQTICEQFEQQGLSIRVVGIDDEARSVMLALAFLDVECEECVMPAEHLERLIASGIKTKVNEPYHVKVIDPRRAENETPVNGGSGPASYASKIIILDPTAAPRSSDLDPGPNAGPLKGRTVGFRVDALWRSWDWVVDEWTTKLTEIGAQVKMWKRWQGLPGDDGAAAQAEYDEFLSSVDLLISGLGNCGSCSAWTIRDAITPLTRGIPTMAAVTSQFVSLARLLAADGGAAGLRILEFPYPLDTRPESEVREIARGIFADALATIGAEA